jgi:hypothetical protein
MITFGVLLTVDNEDTLTVIFGLHKAAGIAISQFTVGIELFSDTRFLWNKNLTSS